MVLPFLGMPIGVRLGDVKRQRPDVSAQGLANNIINILHDAYMFGEHNNRHMDERRENELIEYLTNVLNKMDTLPVLSTDARHIVSDPSDTNTELAEKSQKTSEGSQLKLRYTPDGFKAAEELYNLLHKNNEIIEENDRSPSLVDEILNWMFQKIEYSNKGTFKDEMTDILSNFHQNGPIYTFQPDFSDPEDDDDPQSQGGS